MASAQDYALKQLTEDYLREFYVNGVNTTEGYRSLMRSGAISFNEPRQTKVIHGFFTEVHSEPAVVPGLLSLRLGVASRAVDPNVSSTYCLIRWVPGLEGKALDCLNTNTEAQAVAQHIDPNWTHVWPVWIAGHYLYWELEITNPDSEPANTGAPATFSGFAIDSRRDSTRE